MQLLNPSHATPAATSSATTTTPAVDSTINSKLSYRKHLLAKASSNQANKSGNQSALMPRSIAKKQLDATSPTTVNPLI